MDGTVSLLRSQLPHHMMIFHAALTRVLALGLLARPLMVEAQPGVKLLPRRDPDF